MMRFFQSPRGTRSVLVLALALAGSRELHCQGVTPRQVAALAAAPSGSAVVAAVNDTGSSRASRLYLFSPATGKLVWQLSSQPTIGSVTISPDGNTVAVGLVGVPDSDAGVLLLDLHSGKQTGALGFDETLNFMPGVTYPRYGSGVSQLAYSPDGSLLYGLSNDTLFAWDVRAKKYLWTRDVPAVIEAPKNLPDPLPYGHATGFALSPDGKQIAAIRDALRVATAGPAKPGHFIERSLPGPAEIESAAFSADNRVLAAGGFGTRADGKTLYVETDLWINGALKPVHIESCGGQIAWTATPDLFACENNTGLHLRNLHDPEKDIGPAAPGGDLPVLKVGSSLWSTAYKNTEWKDPSKPLTITLVELGTGHQIALTLPGR